MKKVMEMKIIFSRKWTAWIFSVWILTLAIQPAMAQSSGISIALNNNAGSRSSVWFVQGEPTLIMNGFDLTPTSLRLPAVIDWVAIDVFLPADNQIADVVIYEDSNGGSPVDAKLVASTQTRINASGVHQVSFSNPVVINSSIIWIGFYLPVGVQFLADRQGSSLLSYWAWTPGLRFDLTNLTTAQILGPADGSSPVSINMGGIARITARATTANSRVAEAYRFEQSNPSPSGTDVLTNYNGCPTLFYDQTDLLITLKGEVQANCAELESWHSPLVPAGYTRRSNSRGIVYDITFMNKIGQVITPDLAGAVTHCVTPALDEQAKAVVGLAHGSPKLWEFLPSQQMGNLVCAEVIRGGLLSYFTPN